MHCVVAEVGTFDSTGAAAAAARQVRRAALLRRASPHLITLVRTALGLVAVERPIPLQLSKEARMKTDFNSAAS
jgi:hypothetical protein